MTDSRGESGERGDGARIARVVLGRFFVAVPLSQDWDGNVSRETTTVEVTLAAEYTYGKVATERALAQVRAVGAQGRAREAAKEGRAQAAAAGNASSSDATLPASWPEEGGLTKWPSVAALDAENQQWPGSLSSDRAPEVPTSGWKGSSPSSRAVEQQTSARPSTRWSSITQQRLSKQPRWRHLQTTKEAVTASDESSENSTVASTNPLATAKHPTPTQSWSGQASSSSGSTRQRELPFGQQPQETTRLWRETTSETHGSGGEPGSSEPTSPQPPPPQPVGSSQKPTRTTGQRRTGRTSTKKRRGVSAPKKG